MTNRKTFLTFTGLILALLALTYLSRKPAEVPATPATEPSASSAYGKLPLHFEPNQGQTDEKVKFLARGSGYTMFITATDAVLALKDRDAATDQPRVVKMRLIGSNPRPEAKGLEKREGTSNYFIGNDAREWRRDIPMFAKVQFDAIYPGIDLVYYGTDQRQLEYDFIVEPGADPNAIRLRLEGTDGIGRDTNGDLVLAANGKELRMHKPNVYQEINSGRKEISGAYSLIGKNEVRFEIGPYDQSKPLIIDPILAYSTFLGGSGDDIGVGIEVNDHGNAFVTGVTISPNFPPDPAAPKLGPGGNYDAFVAKLSADGKHLVYSTYLGGMDEENIHSPYVYSDIAIDKSGNAYLTGLTKSADFPVFPNPGAYQIVHGGGTADVYVAKLNPSGNTLLYSTFLGGAGFDGGHAIAVDAAGQAYVTGTMGSDTIPANGFQPKHAAPCPSGNSDAFVARLDTDGTALLYFTYLGGDSCNLGSDIALDASQNAYVMGETSSTNLPVTLDAYDKACGTDGTCNKGVADIFVLKVNPNITGAGSLSYLSYLGGSNEERVGYSGGITVDKEEVIYVTALTASVKPADFPLEKPAQPTPNCYPDTCQPEAFITKLKGDKLLYSTYLGGPGLDWGSGIKVDITGNAYVVGNSGGTFPSTQGMPTCIDPGVFVTKLNSIGVIQWAGCISGLGQDTGLDIALDPAGCAYLTGWTESASYPTVNAFDDIFGGGSTIASDGFVTKVCSGLDHFKCYDVTGQKYFEPVIVHLRDQFEGETVRVMRPVSLCNPVLKCPNNPASPLDCSQRLNPDDHMVCYEVRHEGGNNIFGKRDVIVSNQFGKEQLLTVHKRQNLLCIPSLKAHVKSSTSP